MMKGSWNLVRNEKAKTQPLCCEWGHKIHMQFACILYPPCCLATSPQSLFSLAPLFRPQANQEFPSTWSPACVLNTPYHAVNFATIWILFARQLILFCTIVKTRLSPCLCSSFPCMVDPWAFIKTSSNRIVCSIYKISSPVLQNLSKINHCFGNSTGVARRHDPKMFQIKWRGICTISRSFQVREVPFRKQTSNVDCTSHASLFHGVGCENRWRLLCHSPSPLDGVSCPH